MQLHAVNKQKPTKKVVGRERETMEEKSQKHHPESRMRCRDDLSVGEDDLGGFCQKPFLLHLRQIISEKEEAV
jgi:hypothetical protein